MSDEPNPGRLLRMNRPVGTAPPASRLAILAVTVHLWAGKALVRLRRPGKVAPFEMRDPLTGQHVSVRVGPLFVVFSVNGRDYYFDRFTGRFDGTGSGV